MLGEGSETEREGSGVLGEGTGGQGGGKWGKRGREAGIWYPPVHPHMIVHTYFAFGAYTVIYILEISVKFNEVQKL